RWSGTWPRAATAARPRAPSRAASTRSRTSWDPPPRAASRPSPRSGSADGGENRALREELDRLRHQLGEGAAPQEASGRRRAVGRGADDEATEDEPPDG